MHRTYINSAKYTVDARKEKLIREMYSKIFDNFWDVFTTRCIKFGSFGKSPENEHYYLIFYLTWSCETLLLNEVFLSHEYRVYRYIMNLLYTQLSGRVCTTKYWTYKLNIYFHREPFQSRCNAYCRM